MSRRVQQVWRYLRQLSRMPHLRAFWHHIQHPLHIGMILVAAVFVLISFLGEVFASRWLDPPILLVIATVYLGVCIWMWLSTDWQHWTWFGAGLILTMAGVGLFFLWIFAGRFDMRVYSHIWLEVVRALFIVGGPFMAYGYVEDQRIDTNGDTRV